MFAELRELLRSGAIRRHQLGAKYLLTLASFYQVLLKICVFDEPWVGMAVWLIACRNKKSTSWIHIST